MPYSYVNALFYQPWTIERAHTHSHTQSNTCSQNRMHTSKVLRRTEIEFQSFYLVPIEMCNCRRAQIYNNRFYLCERMEMHVFTVCFSMCCDFTRVYEWRKWCCIHQYPYPNDLNLKFIISSNICS